MSEKYEMYRIVAQRDDRVVEFRVRGTSHVQHVWNKTHINGLADSAVKKIRGLRQEGYTLHVEIAERLIGIENQ